MALTDSDIADMLISTLEDLGRLRFSLISTKLQRYEVMGRLLKQDSIQFDSGIGIQRNILIKEDGTARMVGLWESDVVNVPDLLTTMEVPWRQTTFNWTWERRELLKNRGPARILDQVKLRRAAAMISAAKLMETQFWAKPSSSSDKTSVFGVPYWITKNATEGFNGGNATGFSGGPGGIDRDAAGNEQWKNYTFDYNTFTKADLLKKLRQAHRKCTWLAPVDIQDYRKGSGQQFRIYTNDAVVVELEDIGEGQNENLGRDLAPYSAGGHIRYNADGALVFRGHPIVWVPQLDSDSDNPLYMLDLSCFYPVILTGDNLRESEPDRAPNQHNVWVIHVDLSWNVLADNPRTCAVGSQAQNNP